MMKSETSYRFHFFFFNDTATTEIYTLSLHDALPISVSRQRPRSRPTTLSPVSASSFARIVPRSEEHTSELQSRSDLVCRLLLEKKTNTQPQQLLVHAALRADRIHIPLDSVARLAG